jgi:hypothetical protein
MSVETWRQVKEYENLYHISNYGNIRSDKNNNKELKQFVNRHGYKIVSLCTNYVKKTFKVHILVSYAFMDAPKIGYEINHIDGNKANNNLNNLEWVTKSENALHAFKLGLRIKKFGEDNPNNKLTFDEVKEIKTLLPSKTNSQIAKIFSVTSQNINSIRKLKSWSYV